MIDGGAGGSTGGGGGINPSELAGYATQAWVEGNYVSKMFFNQMFELQYSQRVLTKDGDTVISDVTTPMTANPNTFVDTTPHTTTDETTGYTVETTNTLTGIKAKTGLWTPSYLSALGQNTSGGGGGGGGASALSDLLDVQLSSPTNGQVLMYNSTLGKWINGTVQSSGGTVTSITMSVPTGFSVSPSTITTNGTFAISFASGYSLPTTAKQSNWDTAYGWGNHANAGYASADDVYTKSQADGKFMTIEAFQRLFRPLNSSGNAVAHPYSSGVDNIKALFGLWTEQYISALGQNSSGGGGGGGSSTLHDLLDVNIPATMTQANDGQVLMYSYSQGKWINGTPNVSWGNITSKPTTIAGYGITDAKIQNGTITLGSDSITPLTSFTETDPTVPAWAKQPSKPSYSFSELTSHPDTIAGYGITDAKFGTAGTDYVPITLGSTTKNVLTSHQTVSGTFWGQSWQNGGTVTGNMSSVGSITMSSDIWMNNGGAIRIKDSGDNYRNVLQYQYNGGANVFSIGYGPLTQGHKTQIEGGTLEFLTAGSQNAGLTAMSIDENGRVYIRQALQGIRIGDGLIVWDSGSNAFKIMKYDTTSANLYTTGGLSALGMNSGSSGSIDTLKVNTAIQCSDSGIAFTYRMLTGLDPETHRETYDSFINLFKESEDQNPSGPTRNYYPCADFNYMVLRGRNGANLDINWWINSNGNAKFNRVYLSSTVYLYTDGSNVKVNIGGTNYTLTKS